VNILQYGNLPGYSGRLDQAIPCALEHRVVYCRTERTNKLADLEKYRADHNLSKKGYELAVLNINYGVAQLLLQVNYLREDAYRKKHNIPTTQRTYAIPPAKLDSTYLSFLKYIDINGQADVVSNDYGNVIRSLKYLDIILVEFIKPDYKYPYLYQALVDQNTKVRDKIAASIKIGESVANETPKKPADSVFAGIIKKYKGKAIYVDFWATWCVPCRMGIETMAPIKEDLKNENVVFL
jgi:hypothetical protein